MAAYNKVPGAIAILNAAVNNATDQWGFVLAASAPAGTTYTLGVTDLATGGGYTAGGHDVSTTSSSESLGTYKLILGVPGLWTASTTGFTFRYVILVDKTQSLNVGYWDYGTNVVMDGANGDTFQFTPDTTNGVYTEV